LQQQNTDRQSIYEELGKANEILSKIMAEQLKPRRRIGFFT
jgi:hypothetical protein